MNKKEKFKRLAEKRVNKAIAMLRLIGNLSNVTIYEYNDKEVKKITDALSSEVSNIKAKFRTKTKNNENDDFKL